MQHRNPGRRGRSTARLSALACLAALVVSTLVVFSSPADAGVGSPGEHGRAAEQSCSNEHAAQRPDSPCLPAPLGGAMSAIDATPLAETLMSSLAKTAGSKIGGVLAGWALDSIFGPAAKDSDVLKQQLDGLQSQMTDLQTQVHQLDIKLGDSIKKLMTQADRNTYDGVAAQVTSDAAAVADYQIQLDSWLKKAPGTPVDGSQSSELQTMRSTLGLIIQHLDLAMVGAGGSRGLIAIYRSVVQSQTPYPTDRFYTSDFTTPMSDMLDYYEALAVQAFNLLAEVNHLSWTVSGTTFSANDALVQTYANLVPTMLTHWNQLATGGVGRLPAHVVADTGTGLMWSRSNLTFRGGKVFCWAYCGDNLSLSTLFDTNSVLDGLSGWSVPTQAQFSALVQGQNAFAFLTAHGFQWQPTGRNVQVNTIPITVPAYWSAGGTTVDFSYFNKISLHDQNYWPVFLPGPGAVAVRPLG